MQAVKIDFTPKYNYEDYQKWEGRWELIEGNAYAMIPFPIIQHQQIDGKIHFQLLKLLENCQKCQVLLPVDWKIDEETGVQPDISVVCDKIGGKFLDKTPVMIFEILSPSTAFKDRTIKYKLYEIQKVKYHVIIDIQARLAEVFLLEKGKYKKI